MKKNELHIFLNRLIRGEASDKEINLFDKFLHAVQRRNKETPEGTKDIIWGKIKSNIIDKQSKIVSMVPILRVAASIILVFGVGMALYLSQLNQDTTYLTKTSGKGQKVTITLSDGSTVRLNAESTITYPEEFTKELREVELVGEAYFDVKKDKARPFIITSHTIQTTVLGTSFNIDAYDASLISVALVEGKVKVNATNKGSADEQEVYLNPGELALYDSNTQNIKTDSFDEKKLIAWKDGIIYMSGAGYEQVFDQLAHWYGVEFAFENIPNEKWDYTGEFKDMTLDRVLNTIGYVKGFEYKILDQEVTVKFKN